MQKILTLIVLLAAAGLFASESFSPVYRLCATMPPGFVDAPASLSAEKRSAEEKLAGDYWNCAVDEIQWRYGYGYRLPQDPPSDFNVASVDPAANSALNADAKAARARYWLRLQRAWYVPDNWTKSYQWDVRWMSGWIDNIKRQVHAS